MPHFKHDVSRDLQSRPQAAAEARRALVGLPLPRETREVLALLVSELVTNAVLHAGIDGVDPIHVDLTTGSASVRLSVRDRGDGFASESLGPPGPLAPGGRGLLIVDALSEAWGVDRGPDGCTVWCKVPIDDHPADDEVITGYVSELALNLAT
jgi:anti-sigma regulatory factor (Ser/Thr protein kinase)